MAVSWAEGTNDQRRMRAGFLSASSLLVILDEALNGCPAPAPTATPAISFTYELGARSTITYTVSTTGVPPLVEALSGTFVAAVLPPQCCRVDLALAITSFEFDSAHFSVSGS